jgi:hypothetical protein
LREEKLWSHDDPIFPATNVVLDKSNHFTVEGLTQKHWSTATPIRVIFREAFTKAGLPYFNPHSFRNTLVRLGQTVCQSPEDFKAWSQNLGHEKVLTTFCSYGEVQSQRQKEILERLKSPQRSMHTDVREIAKAILHEINATQKQIR